MTINKKSIKNNKIGGMMHVKDDPDKLNKDDYDTKIEDEEIEEDIEEEKEEDEEELEEEEEELEEQEEKEIVDKEEESGDEECLYNLTKKKNIIDIDLEEGEDNFDDEEELEQKNKIASKYVKPDERVTKPFLFEFERVRILGERAKQLSLGAKPMLKNIENYDPKMIARMELKNKVLPLIILRELPDGRIEKWKVSELNY